MNCKQRGLAPFKNEKMDRFPMWYGAAPEFTDNLVKYLGAKDEDEALYDIIGIDYKTIRPKYIGKPLMQYDDGSVDTDWGITRGGLHYGQAINHPMSEFDSIEQVEKYAFPNPDNYDHVISEEQREWAKNHCLIAGNWAPFFHDSTELVGMEKFFVEMYINPGFVEAVIEKCYEYDFELERRVFEANKNIIDMHFIGNDFGSQRALLLSPDMWRQFYKPHMKKLIEQAKKNGCVTAIHSCGTIYEIIPDLIEIGVDAVNPIQVNAEHMTPEFLMNEFGSDIVFFGGIDENEILINQTEQQVRDETRRIIDLLGSKGRYVVAASHDYLLPEVPVQNIIAMYDEAKKYGTGR